jgi:acetoacetyl-CoA synthetase
VHSGELQGPALGMKIKAYNEHGNSIVNKPGELICEIPTPSMPLYFWNDPNDKEYKKTYFTKYPKVWCHGDWIKINDDTGGITFFGRSDFILNPSGVRIGPAEIYAVIEQVKEISDSLVVSKNIKGNEQIILFVKLNLGLKLTDIIIKKIKQLLKEDASPRHVPYLILEVPDIPYTFNMKKVESAVSNIINDKPITNRDALINPKSLDFFQILSKTI